MYVSVRKIGNSRGVLIPKVLLEQLGIRDTLSMVVDGDAIILKKPAAEAPQSDCAVAAMRYALSAEEGMAFLRCWFHGDFEAIRKKWPDAPNAVFAGADPLHKDATPS